MANGETRHIYKGTFVMATAAQIKQYDDDGGWVKLGTIAKSEVGGTGRIVEVREGTRDCILRLADMSKNRSYVSVQRPTAEDIAAYEAAGGWMKNGARATIAAEGLYNPDQPAGFRSPTHMSVGVIDLNDDEEDVNETRDRTGVRVFQFRLRLAGGRKTDWVSSRYLSRPTTEENAAFDAWEATAQEHAKSFAAGDLVKTAAGNFGFISELNSESVCIKPLIGDTTDWMPLKRVVSASKSELQAVNAWKAETAKCFQHCGVGSYVKTEAGTVGYVSHYTSSGDEYQDESDRSDRHVRLFMASLMTTDWINVKTLVMATDAETQEFLTNGGWVHVGNFVRTSQGVIGCIIEFDSGKTVKLRMADMTTSDWIKASTLGEANAEEVQEFKANGGWLQAGAHVTIARAGLHNPDRPAGLRSTSQACVGVLTSDINESQDSMGNRVFLFRVQLAGTNEETDWIQSKYLSQPSAAELEQYATWTDRVNAYARTRKAGDTVVTQDGKLGKLYDTSKDYCTVLFCRNEAKGINGWDGTFYNTGNMWNPGIVQATQAEAKKYETFLLQAAAAKESCKVGSHVKMEDGRIGYVYAHEENYGVYVALSDHTKIDSRLWCGAYVEASAAEEAEFKNEGGWMQQGAFAEIKDTAETLFDQRSPCGFRSPGLLVCGFIEEGPETTRNRAGDYVQAFRVRLAGRREDDRNHLTDWIQVKNLLRVTPAAEKEFGAWLGKAEAYKPKIKIGDIVKTDLGKFGSITRYDEEPTEENPSPWNHVQLTYPSGQESDWVAAHHVLPATSAEKSEYEAWKKKAARTHKACKVGSHVKLESTRVGRVVERNSEGYVQLFMENLIKTDWLYPNSFVEASKEEIEAFNKSGGWIKVGQLVKTKARGVGRVAEGPYDRRFRVRLADQSITDWLRAASFTQPTKAEEKKYNASGGWCHLGAIAKRKNDGAIGIIVEGPDGDSDLKLRLANMSITDWIKAHDTVQATAEEISVFNEQGGWLKKDEMAKSATGVVGRITHGPDRYGQVTMLLADGNSIDSVTCTNMERPSPEICAEYDAWAKSSYSFRAKCQTDAYAKTARGRVGVITRGPEGDGDDMRIILRLPDGEETDWLSIKSVVAAAEQDIKTFESNGGWVKKGTLAKGKNDVGIVIEDRSGKIKLRTADGGETGWYRIRDLCEPSKQEAKQYKAWAAKSSEFKSVCAVGKFAKTARGGVGVVTQVDGDAAHKYVHLHLSDMGRWEGEASGLVEASPEDVKMFENSPASWLKMGAYIYFRKAELVGEVVSLDDDGDTQLKLANGANSDLLRPRYGDKLLKATGAQIAAFSGWQEKAAAFRPLAKVGVYARTIGGDVGEITEASDGNVRLRLANLQYTGWISLEDGSLVGATDVEVDNYKDTPGGWCRMGKIAVTNKGKVGKVIEIESDGDVVLCLTNMSKTNRIRIGYGDTLEEGDEEDIAEFAESPAGWCETGAYVKTAAGQVGVVIEGPDRDGDMRLRLWDMSNTDWIRPRYGEKIEKCSKQEIADYDASPASWCKRTTDDTSWQDTKLFIKTKKGAVGMIQDGPDFYGRLAISLADSTTMHDVSGAGITRATDADMEKYNAWVTQSEAFKSIAKLGSIARTIGGNVGIVAEGPASQGEVRLKLGDMRSTDWLAAASVIEATVAETEAFMNSPAGWCKFGAYAKTSAGKVGIVAHGPDSDGDLKLRLSNLQLTDWIRLRRGDKLTKATAAEVKSFRAAGGWVSVGEHCKTSTGAVGVIREMYDDGHIKLQLTDCTITDWIQSKNVRQPSAKEVAAYEEASGWIKIGAVARAPTLQNQIGVIGQGPDGDGDVKLRMPDGSWTGWIRIPRDGLFKATKAEVKAFKEQGGSTAFD